MKTKLYLITIILLLILCNSCGTAMHDFVGVWVSTENNSQLISIKQNGDSFLIEQNKQNYPAKMEGDFLVLNTEQKAIFNKDKANLIINGIEYYRMTGDEFVGKWASSQKKGLLDINRNGDTFNIVWKSKTDMYQVKEYKLKFEDGKLVTNKDSYVKVEISYNNPKSIEIIVDDNPEFDPLVEKLSPANLEPTKLKLDDSKPDFFYVINTTVTKTELKAKQAVKELKNKGYNANYLWIPDYKSLAGAEFYSVYIGPFSTQSECEIETEKYRKIDDKAYALLVSQENKRVEIRGIGKVKIIEPYHK